MSATHGSPIEELIRHYYDREAEQEWQRLERHRTEFAVTVRALLEHLPPPPARVLDCGGGPGRYAIELARSGYEVTLFDLSPGNLQLAQRKAAEAGVTLAGYEQGTATDLTRFTDNSFDAVLLMGPLYHLLEEEERRRALAEAYRVLKAGGRLFAAFIGRYAAHLDAAAHYPTEPPQVPELYETILTSGRLHTHRVEEPEFVAYLAHPTEVGRLCQRMGFELMTVLAVEGLVSMIEDGINALSGEAWQWWLDLNYRVAADSSIHGCAEHLLVIADKPRWRTVLRQIACQLDEAGVTYKVVGGASAALHGVPVRVKDLDLETGAGGAYHFQDLFASHAVKPVALRETELYRSHFGCFDFDGVAVEIMGNLQRREADDWVPSAATTETAIHLEGVPVRVSWLEEETLAYIRRGRLERAALCLPHCDHGRLLALLRGEHHTDVL